MTRIFPIVLALLLTGCMTFRYEPGRYPLGEARIDDLVVNGQLAISNEQTDAEERRFSYGPLDVLFNYRSVTARLVESMAEEVGRHGVAGAEAVHKTVALKVIDFSAERQQWHTRSQMSVAMRLGNGYRRVVKVSHGSPASLDRVLDGTIALGVVQLLGDPHLRAYLAE